MLHTILYFKCRAKTFYRLKAIWLEGPVACSDTRIVAEAWTIFAGWVCSFVLTGPWTPKAMFDKLAGQRSEGVLSRAFLSSRVLVQTASAANCNLIWLYKALQRGLEVWSFQGFVKTMTKGQAGSKVQDSRVPGFQVPISKVPRSRAPRFDRGSRSVKFQSSRVPGFQGSRISFQGSRFQDSRVPGFLVQVAFTVPGFQGFQGSKSSRVPGVQGSRFQYPRFQGPGLQGSTGVPEVWSFKVPGFQGSRISFQGSRFQDSRVPGFLVQVAFTVPGFQGFQGSKSSRGPGFQKFPKSRNFKIPGFQG